MPTISAKRAIDLAEGELSSCQFFPEKIAWTLSNLELKPYRADDGKTLWCWVLTFGNPEDIENKKVLSRNLIKIAVLLNGETIAPTFSKFEIDGSELMSLERELQSFNPELRRFPD